MAVARDGFGLAAQDTIRPCCERSHGYECPRRRQVSSSSSMKMRTVSCAERSRCSTSAVEQLPRRIQMIFGDRAPVRCVRQSRSPWRRLRIHVALRSPILRCRSSCRGGRCVRAPTLDTTLRASASAAPTGSHRAGASRCCGLKLSLTVRGKGEACEDVRFGEIGEVAEDLLVAHSGGEVAEDVRNGDAQTAYAGLAAALSGFHCYDLRIIHRLSLRDGQRTVKENETRDWGGPR